MKKQILSIVLLLSVCTGQVVLGSEGKVANESASLLEKYIPGARTAKKMLYGAVLTSLFVSAGGSVDCITSLSSACKKIKDAEGRMLMAELGSNEHWEAQSDLFQAETERSFERMREWGEERRIQHEKDLSNFFELQ